MEVDEGGKKRGGWWLRWKRKRTEEILYRDRFSWKAEEIRGKVIGVEI